MGGFANATNGDKVVFDLFAPSQLPVKMALAKEFGLFDRFFSAVPAPSQPNHMFAQSATSCGVTDTGVAYTECGGTLPLFPQRTIFDSMLADGKQAPTLHYKLSFGAVSDSMLADGEQATARSRVYAHGHIHARMHVYMCV